MSSSSLAVRSSPISTNGVVDAEAGPSSSRLAIGLGSGNVLARRHTGLNSAGR